MITLKALSLKAAKFEVASSIWKPFRGPQNFGIGTASLTTLGYTIGKGIAFESSMFRTSRFQTLFTFCNFAFLLSMRSKCTPEEFKNDIHLGCISHVKFDLKDIKLNYAVLKTNRCKPNNLPS